ncbi:MAG: hypothetical protein EP335_17435 [Alphaproteobacteria bacterium]|nr:MAG: hypothetical protein EP335_17435 [Alphaproteobacteria bacterium]
MARKLSGETALKVGARTVRLRLDIGTMIDLEDHLGMGLVPFLAERLPEGRLADMALLYLAMTGGDFTDRAAVKKAAETIVKAGIVPAAEAIAGCLETSLTPPESARALAPGKQTPPPKP